MRRRSVLSFAILLISGAVTSTACLGIDGLTSAGDDTGDASIDGNPFGSTDPDARVNQAGSDGSVDATTDTKKAPDGSTSFTDTGSDVDPDRKTTIDGSAPPPRAYHAIAYSEARQLTLLFGGLASNGSYLNDTWEWDGASWRARNVSPAPSARYLHAMAHDSAHNAVLLFGGSFGFSTGFADTWLWNGQWQQQTTPKAPSARIGAAMADDTPRGRVMLFGGREVLAGGGLGAYLGDTWAWDGTWTQLFPSAAPPPRVYAACAQDRMNVEIVLFGGVDATATLTDTWVWTGATWSERVTGSNPSAGVSGIKMASLPVSQRTILVGTNQQSQTETWIWGGGGWSQYNSSTTPPARNGFGLTFDFARSQVVLFGGSTSGGANVADTWEWFGSNWTQRTP